MHRLREWPVALQACWQIVGVALKLHSSPACSNEESEKEPWLSVLDTLAIQLSIKDGNRVDSSVTMYRSMSSTPIYGLSPRKEGPLSNPPGL